MPSREDLLRLKAALKFTWEPFFSRFGRFTAVQENAIPVILRGQDCLLSSQTASGKTEAATAPLVERLKKEKWEGLSVVYISPTRALVNDLFRRLEPRLDEVGVTIGRRTGDTPNLNISDPPSILITTPESFDALMSRTPRLFMNVRAVVLDEIHLLDGSPRGDQVRLLLHRLRALRSDACQREGFPDAHVQTLALSATVSDPEGVASRYCLDPQIIRVEGKRSIEADFQPLASKADLHRAVLTFRDRDIRKVLVFCASRPECEELATSIRNDMRGLTGGWGNPFGDNVFVHHASLDRNVRLDVEQRFAQGQVGICFATSTLELGIDIGDIDQVILIGPPYSIGSFLQRIGRGNRRTNRTTVLGFYRTGRERLLFQLLLHAAENGEQDDSDYSLRPSVVVQQMLSYLKQIPDGALSPRNVRVLLDEPSSGQPILNKHFEDALISHLLETDILRRSDHGMALEPSERACEIYEKHREISNIGGNGRDLAVVDDLTGRTIGRIETGSLPGGNSFLLGGNRLDHVRTEGKKLAVSIDNEKPDGKPIRPRALRRFLPYKLASRIGEAMGVLPGEFPAFEFEGRWHLIHALGDLYGLILKAFVVQEHGWKASATTMSLTLDMRPHELTFAPNEKVISDLVMRNYQRLESHLSMGPFQTFLPDALRQHSVLSAFNPAQFCKAVSGRSITITDEADRIQKYRSLLQKP